MSNILVPSLISLTSDYGWYTLYSRGPTGSEQQAEETFTPCNSLRYLVSLTPHRRPVVLNSPELTLIVQSR